MFGHKRVTKTIGFGVLLLWTAGILFPFGWPAQLSTTYRTVFDTVFFAPWTHEPTHFALFFVLGWLLAGLLSRAPSRFIRRYSGPIFALVVVGVACGQEAFQLVHLHRFPGPAEVLDVSVDMAGAASGAVACWLWARRRSADSLPDTR